jgi:hypothetical protein
MRWDLNGRARSQVSSLHQFARAGRIGKLNVIECECAATAPPGL